MKNGRGKRAREHNGKAAHSFLRHAGVTRYRPCACIEVAWQAFRGQGPGISQNLHAISYYEI